MKKRFLLLLLLSCSAFGQSVIGTITAQGSTCATAGACVSIVLGPNTAGVGVSVSGTYSGTLQFEGAADSANFVNLVALPQPTGIGVQSTTSTGTWVIPISGISQVRVRGSAYSSGTAIIAFQPSNAEYTLPTAQPLASAGASGANPCINPHANLQSVSFTTSGTTAVQEIAISGTTKVYGCALNVIGQSGTTPTFSLVFGTGVNCASGQGTLVPAFATPANTLFPFVSPVFVTSAGQAVCYLDGGTTPVQVATLTFVQQ